MHIRGIRLATEVLAVSALLAACSLTSLFYPPVDYSDPDFSLMPGQSEFAPYPSDFAPAILRHGTATITITTGEPRVVQLPHLSGADPSMVLSGFAAIVAWRGGDWELKIEAAETPLMGSGMPALTIIREDTDPPLQADGSTCTITYTAKTATHVAGHADCKGLAWVDGLGDLMDLPVPSGSPTSDHPLFDATIVFDATP
jgi:hypothetical protein